MDHMKMHKREQGHHSLSSKDTEFENESSLRKLLKKERDHLQKLKKYESNGSSRNEEISNSYFSKHPRIRSSGLDESDRYSRSHERDKHNKHSCEEAESDKWSKRQRNHTGKSSEREVSSHGLYRRESGEWSESENSNSLKFEDRDSDSLHKCYKESALLKDDREKEEYSYSRYLGRENSVEYNEDVTSLNRKHSMAVLHHNEIVIDPQIRRKFAEACASFLRASLNRKPSTSRTNKQHMEYSERVAVAQRSSERFHITHRSPYTSDSDAQKDEASKCCRSEKRRRKSRHDHDEWGKSSRPYDSDVAYKGRSDKTCHKSQSRRSRYSHNHKRKIERKSDPVTIYKRRIKKIQEQCKKEKDPGIRRALLSLHEIHCRECLLYLRKPDAHPDYGKEYRMFAQQKAKSILEIRGDPYTFDYYLEWRKYWPLRMNELLEESWEIKKQKCINILSQKKK